MIHALVALVLLSELPKNSPLDVSVKIDAPIGGDSLEKYKTPFKIQMTFTISSASIIGHPRTFKFTDKWNASAPYYKRWFTRLTSNSSKDLKNEYNIVNLEYSIIDRKGKVFFHHLLPSGPLVRTQSAVREVTLSLTPSIDKVGAVSIEHKMFIYEARS